jgi:predicted nucleic acid-binding protein
MRLIDTSSWIEAMRRDGDPGVRARVGGLMSRGEAAWCDMVLLELWNGVRVSAERTLLDSLAADVVLLPMTDGAWDRARQLARRSRAGGLTVPGADLVIAGCAWEHGVPVEHRDRHLSALAGLFGGS